MDFASEGKPVVALLVEDVPAESQRIELLLESHPAVRFRVDCARSVEEGLSMLSEHSYDVMLLDLSLPEGTGLTTLMRAREAAPTIPIVVLADEDDEALALDAVSLGAQDYVVKQVDDRVLVRVALSAIERHRVLRELRSARRHEYYLATHDSLTGLLNRFAFLEALSSSVERARRHEERLGVLFFDLDNLKTINDTLGHAAGDDVLREVSARLSRIVRSSDKLARLGGDEFTMLIHNVADESAVETVAQRILAMLADPFVIDEREFRVGISIGAAIFPEDAKEPESLIRNADIAMYHAKESGGNRFHLYQQGMAANLARRIRAGRTLRDALHQEQFVLHYQPQIDLETGDILVVEALLRWRDPEGGWNSPERFIRDAEQADMITEIGEWTVKAAAADLSRWQRDAGTGLRVAINISPRQLGAPSFAQGFLETVHEFGLDPALFEIEVTENIALDSQGHGVANLRQLGRRGVRTAIDDFGTGFGNIQALKMLPVDTIKIDRSFMADVPGSQTDREIVRAIVALGSSLGKEIAAEGIERPEQLAFLRGLRCARVQGYLLAAPLPPEKISLLLQEGEPPWMDLLRSIPDPIEE